MPWVHLSIPVRQFRQCGPRESWRRTRWSWCVPICPAGARGIWGWTPRNLPTPTTTQNGAYTIPMLFFFLAVAPALTLLMLCTRYLAWNTVLIDIIYLTFKISVSLNFHQLKLFVGFQQYRLGTILETLKQKRSEKLEASCGKVLIFSLYTKFWWASWVDRSTCHVGVHRIQRLYLRR